MYMNSKSTSSYPGWGWGDCAGRLQVTDCLAISGHVKSVVCYLSFALLPLMLSVPVETS